MISAAKTLAVGILAALVITSVFLLLRRRSVSEESLHASANQASANDRGHLSLAPLPPPALTDREATAGVQPFPGAPVLPSATPPSIASKVFIIEGAILNANGFGIERCTLSTDAWHSPTVTSGSDGRFTFELSFLSGSSLPKSLAYFGPHVPAGSISLSITADERHQLHAARTILAEEGSPLEIRVIDQGFQPVAKAVVSLCSSAGWEVGTLGRYDLSNLVARGWRRVFSGTPSGCAVTDMDGRATIALSPGSYDVEAWKPGFVPFAGKVASVPCYEQLDIQLEPGKTISGVVKRNQLPFQGAAICIKDGPERSYFARTDDAGQFVLGGLLRDEVSVLAWGSGSPICRWDRQRVAEYCYLDMCSAPALLLFLVDAPTQEPISSGVRVTVEVSRAFPRDWLEFASTVENGQLVLQEIGDYANSILIVCPGYQPCRIEKREFTDVFGEPVMLTPLQVCRISVTDSASGGVIPEVILSINRVQWEDFEGAKRASQDIFGAVDIPFILTSERIESDDEVAIEIGCEGYVSKSIVLREPGGVLPPRLAVELDGRR